MRRAVTYNEFSGLLNIPDVAVERVKLVMIATVKRSGGT